jgi:Ca2+-binding RTX toxin-like protein
MASFIGDSGDNSFIGTADSDSFDLSQGGDDTADGGAGGDSFYLGAAFTAADQLTGGAGIDDLQLDGDYSAGVVMSNTTLVGFEAIGMAAGHSYSLTLDDAAATTADFGYFNVNATTLGVGDHLIFDGSAETDTMLRLHAGAGDDHLIGGQAGNIFDLFAGGADTCLGGAGADVFDFAGTSFDRFDHLDGGAGVDFLNLDGDFSAMVRFRPTTMVNVENISLAFSHSYALKISDGTVAAGETLSVIDGNQSAGQFLKFIGKFESNGFLDVNAGAGDDTLVGGGMADTLFGGDGKDRILGKGGADNIFGGHGVDLLSGGAGADTFVFQALTDSAVAKPDLITDLQKIDFIDLSEIDADSGTAGDQAFVLVGSFTHHAGEATLSYDSGTDRTSLMLDVDGDGVSDSTIVMAGDQSSHSNFFL